MGYGEKTLHEAHGVAVALNVGDLLIGEGYRLLASCPVSAEQRVRMLRVAAEGQRQLCRGQGAELCWSRHPQPPRSNEVLDIFRRKTAPAFEVALRLGALHAGVDRHDDVSEVLGRYSEALGVAYQIRDDLSDLGLDGETNDIDGLRPSLLLAAHEWRGRAKDLPLALADVARRRDRADVGRFTGIWAQATGPKCCSVLIRKRRFVPCTTSTITI